MKASGFKLMSLEKRREIASKGGKRAHEMGLAHEWNSEEAKAAGRKGGLTVSADRARMAELGRLGGLERGKRRRAAKEAAVLAESLEAVHG